MNRKALVEAMGLVTDLGLPEMDVNVDSSPVYSYARITYHPLSDSLERLRPNVTAVLGEPSGVRWFDGHSIAEWTRGAVRVEIWNWVPTCPTCGHASKHATCAS